MLKPYKSMTEIVAERAEYTDPTAGGMKVASIRLPEQIHDHLDLLVEHLGYSSKQKLLYDVITNAVGEAMDALYEQFQGTPEAEGLEEELYRIQEHYREREGAQS